MNTKTTHTALLTALSALVAAATVGCAGSPSRDYYPPSPSVGDAAAEAPAHPGYSQPGYGQSAPSESVAEVNAGRAADAAPAPRSAPAKSSRRWDGADDAPSAQDPFELQQRTRRPGLATQWGEQRRSRVTSAPFVRADRSEPFALAKMFYNDPLGIAAMSDGRARRGQRRFTIAGGHLEMALRDGSGRFMSGFRAGNDNYISARSGTRYTIFIKNHTPGRIEAVVSVDGLDVIDGKSASPHKRGYLLDPFGDLEIEGFRTSTNNVAAFRFGAVEKSYAARKHGETRNVGVVGVAVFHERGDSPRFWGSPRSRDDSHQRHNANPFPQFATPAN